MKSKTIQLIDKIYNEELAPMQQQLQQSPQQPQQPVQQAPQQSQQQGQQSDKEQEQKIEVYIPLTDGMFNGYIFTTANGVSIKVIDSSLESDSEVMSELQNNPDSYHKVSTQKQTDI
jgi:hypothetical protein